jgi:dipeptidyl-peptidase-4
MTARPAGVRYLMRTVQALSLLVLVAALAPAQSGGKQAPKANYKLASKYSLANLTPMMYSTSVVPTFIGKTDNFWYSFRTSKGTNYWRVEPAKKSKAPLFDHEKLAGQLAELSRKPVEATALSLARTQVSSDGLKFSFAFSEMLYEYDLKDEKLISKGKAPAGPPAGPGGRFGGGKGKGRRISDDVESVDVIEGQDEPQQKELDKKKDLDKKELDKTRRPGFPTRPTTTRAMSPDKKTVLFTKDNNLYIADAGKEKEAKQLTKDGSADYNFLLFSAFQPAPPRGPMSNRAIWAKDSKHFYAIRQDKRNMKELFLVDSLATPRPKLVTYKYSMPGEEFIQKSELHFGSREARTIVRITQKWKDEAYSDLHWGKEPGELRFVRRDRLIRNLELCALDAGTGKCRVLVSEGFENAPVDYQAPHYLTDTDEMIWWSERTGWGHFYLYDTDGKRKNAITSGAWRASQIVSVDEKNRVLYFRGNAREKGENLYYPHLYSVKFDGSGLTLLDPGDAYHSSTLSPSREYVIDNASRVDKGPECVLRDHKGQKVMDLEKADLSRLTAYGWKAPETFSVKAADGVTELYGNMWKPFDFDPKKKYPIIAHVYPGPQQEGVTYTFTVYNQNMQLAQLGFIVIQVGHRGGAPTRSKAYHSYGYFNLRDYGLADKKHAIEQLAARHSWIDVKQVGIFGHSGGGFMSAAAMLQKPYNEFFKAAVASAGNHDNNIYNNWWAERHHGAKAVPVKAEEKKTEVKDKTRGPAGGREPLGPPRPKKNDPPKTTASTSTTTTPVGPPPPSVKFEIKVPTNAELAANLKGRLMLVHGELDNNVHPANTMRLADALIKANKRFDMLIIPGMRHGFGPNLSPYFQRRMHEFFAEHLLGDRRGGADMTEKEE